MLFAILSLIFGLLTLIGGNFSIPRLLAELHLSGLKGIVIPFIKLSPILGIVLGIYGLVIERRSLRRQESVETMCIIGIIANGAPFFLPILQKIAKF